MTRAMVLFVCTLQFIRVYSRGSRAVLMHSFAIFAPLREALYPQISKLNVRPRYRIIRHASVLGGVSMRARPISPFRSIP
jgi:hypothetical protein